VTTTRGDGVVLIATSDTSVGGQIVRLFERAGYSASQVSTGAKTLTEAKDGRTRLILLDLKLAGMSGYEACFELREDVGRDLPIIFLSGERTEPSDRVAGLLIGADDYLTKPFDPDELLARARRLLARTPDSHPTAESPLTERETQILRLLADGLSQRRIAKELFISPKTVGSHVQRILSKLAVHSRTEAVALAYREGLIGEVERRADL
jgi:DNA-binding NarL/FixJ family response regulator